MKRILVTGGHGYIGSALIENLRSAVQLDICDISDGIEGDFAHVEVGDYDVVINLAAYSSVKQCDDFPKLAWKTNVTSFESLLKRINGSQLLITASSATVYGVTEGSADENHVIGLPVKLYDTTKMINDFMTQTALASGKNIVSLRFGTVAGASPHMRYDSVVNGMCSDAIKKGIVSVINPDVRRSILFLPDLIHAIRLILNFDANQSGGIYNLSSLNTSIREIAENVANTVGHVEIKVLDGASSNYDGHMNANKFINKFGDFRISSFTEIIHDIINLKHGGR
jgi:nucleoside-diphosphate-sugar epimerase